MLPVSVQDCEVACEMAQPAVHLVLLQPDAHCLLPEAGRHPSHLQLSQTTPCYEANQNLQVLSQPLCMTFKLTFSCARSCNSKRCLEPASPVHAVLDRHLRTCHDLYNSLPNMHCSLYQNSIHASLYTSSFCGKHNAPVPSYPHCST